MRHFDEQRPEFAPYGFTCEVWEPAPMPRPDRHDEIEINFLDQGTLTYLIGGRRRKVATRSLTLFWAAVPHQVIQFHNVASYYVITIPFGQFLEWGLPEPLQRQLVLGNVVSDCDEPHAVDDSALFAQWHADLARSPGEFQDIVRLELKARLLRLARSLRVAPASAAVDDPHPGTAPSLGKAEQMAAFIARNFRSRLKVEEIAASVALHPDYASTLFRKTFGTTFTKQITRHRVAEAQRQLITTDEQILTIAYNAGFDSVSRFNRAFKETTGMTPRTYRQQRAVAG